MSISAYTGLPGGGKSYGVVAHVLIPALKEGRTVVTNLPLKSEVVAERFPGAKIVPLNLADIEPFNGPKDPSVDYPPGAVWIIDELWKLWPAGTKANQADPRHKKFLAEHRHIVGEDGRSTEVCLVTQDLAQIANFARILVEKTYIVTKLDQLGASKMYRVDVYQGAICGPRGSASLLINSLKGRYSPEIYALYTSHTHSATGGAGSEVKVDKRASIWRRPLFLAVVPVLVLSVFGVKWAMGRVFGDTVQLEEAVAVADTVPGPPVREPRVSLPAAGEALYTPPSSQPSGQGSTVWRLAGYVRCEVESEFCRSVVILMDGSKIRRFGLDDCRLDRLDPFCLVDGQKVTFWTGDQGGRLRLPNIFGAEGAEAAQQPSTS